MEQVQRAFRTFQFTSHTYERNHWAAKENTKAEMGQTAGNQGDRGASSVGAVSLGQ